MALRGTLTHWKTRILAAELQIDPSHALGLLEALWHVTAEDAPPGDIGRLSNEAIAMQMFCRFDPNALIEAMLKSRHLEYINGVLVVHHWSEHSDDSVDNKLARNGLYYFDGQEPRMRRLSNKERERICEKFGFTGSRVRIKAHGVRTAWSQVGTKSHEKPLPVPVPVPVPEESTTEDSGSLEVWKTIEHSPPSPSQKTGGLNPIREESARRSDPDFDETWQQFRMVAERAGMHGSEPDWKDGWVEWRVLSIEQKLLAQKFFSGAEADDYRRSALPRNFLMKHMWERRNGVEKKKTLEERIDWDALQKRADEETKAGKGRRKL